MQFFTTVRKSSIIYSDHDATTGGSTPFPCVILENFREQWCDTEVLSRTSYKGANESDFWLVVTDTKRPIMVIAVKSPDTPGVLDDPCVKGQIFDCMLDAMSFFGPTHILGVTIL